MYLMIQNPGHSPVEVFTILGVSTTRNCGNSSTIGTFGTGSKHAVNLLLRNGIKPIIFCSQLRLEFFASQTEINDGLGTTSFGLVHCKQSGKTLDGQQVNRTKDLGFVLEHGIHDWTDLAMGLREFVSNAIDRTLREEDDFRAALKDGRLCVKLVEDKSVRAKDGYTRVFVPVTSEVQRFYGELPRRFLHFGEPWNLDKKILPKTGRNLGTGQGAMIYKKGVFVREVTQDISLFDYNFGNELELDESRNVDDYAVRSAASRLLRDSDVDTLTTVFRSLAGDTKFWESAFGKYDLSPSWDREEKKVLRKKIWGDAWKKAMGDKVLCGRSVHENQVLRGKGYEPVLLMGGGWEEAGVEIGVPNSGQILSKAESEGKQVLPATLEMEEALNTVWGWVEKLGLTKGREKPIVKSFKNIMDGGNRTLGYYESNTVHIEESQGGKDLLRTVMEEVCHHITQSNDCSRDFQEFLIQMIVDLAVLVSPPHTVASL